MNDKMGVRYVGDDIAHTLCLFICLLEMNVI